jgi:hypothetical protein
LIILLYWINLKIFCQNESKDIKSLNLIFRRTIAMRHILALLLFIAVPALGENLFVDPNNPEGFATIADAVKRADEGDVIFISEGFYAETISIEKNISLIGEGADLVLLSYAQSGNAINISAEVDTAAVIEGLTITAKGGAGIAIAQGGSATIRNCLITRCAQQAIAMNNSQSIIRLNILSENGVGAIYSYQDQGTLITNNIIVENIGGLGDPWGATGTVYYQEGVSGIFANNLVKGNTGVSGGLFCWGASPTIKNNVFVENSNSGIHLHGLQSSVAAPLITSNILANNGTYGISGARANYTPVITYNNTYDNASADYEALSSDVGDIDEDPEFVNPGKDDYHLQETSPCIDTGLTGAANVDPDGSRNDMGMYGGPLASLWIEPYNGPVVTGVEVNPASVQQGGTITIRATGTTVREE